MAILGAAEERRLFSDGAVGALMHWPDGYSVDAAQWVSEACDAYSRPLGAYSRGSLSAVAPPASVGPLRNASGALEHPPAASAGRLRHPERVPHGSGLFSDALFPSRSRGDLTPQDLVALGGVSTGGGVCLSEGQHQQRCSPTTSGQGEEAQTLDRAAAASAAAPACQLLLQTQHEILKQQYQQVEQLRVQLQQLGDMLSTLRLQVSGSSQGTTGSHTTPIPQSANTAMPSGGLQNTVPEDADLDPLDVELGDDYLGWSLDPRDYKEMPAEALDWIPPAGIPSGQPEH
ncbi:uncharacterized protein LOC113146689 [Cyclospora cayetanensis]|uniref:Uncharacterized protein LOC113146689 n=1 Tax=Cyclospora cayetanensis TaxID=88456 RepID=A0A6P6RS18_9EIME|nr:uncharacterized protein LOC113146689 [Cyclospora cayetanensis]